MYWSMIEDGIAVIATSLPTLHYFVARTSMQSVVRSVRSVISLRSLRTSHDTSSTNLERPNHKGVDGAEFFVYGMQSGNYNTQVTSDPLDAQDATRPGVIQVKKDLRQTDKNMV